MARKELTQQQLDIAGLVALTVRLETEQRHDASRRYQLDWNTHRPADNAGDSIKYYYLRSQDRGSRWSSNVITIPVTRELGEALTPLFPAPVYRRSKTWLTLASICRKLGATSLAKDIEHAKKRAKAAARADEIVRTRNQISDRAWALLEQLQRDSEKREELLDMTDNVKIMAVTNALADLIRNLAYVPRGFEVGDAVNVALPNSYSRQSGVVLGVCGNPANPRLVRVDVKQQDGTASVMELDASAVTKA